ncbi:hypothetical protein C5S31_10115 [ANME-1 cluster archaeon GoMg2]|nr:hypothetical protein [ANME-1 cluster archaeon GoMg2]
MPKPATMSAKTRTKEDLKVKKETYIGVIV